MILVASCNNLLAFSFCLSNALTNFLSPCYQFAAKELQKINFFKAPRDKLLCIMNCCRIINNLLLDISMTTNHTPAGADDFLPILIYVTIKASSLSTYFLPVLYILLSK